MTRYLLYVVDSHGRQMTMLDTHNHNGNRSWYLPTDKPFTVVLESDSVITYLVLDEQGDMIIEQEDVKPPKPPPKSKKRKSRFWKNRPPEYRPGEKRPGERSR